MIFKRKQLKINSLLILLLILSVLFPVISMAVPPLPSPPSTSSGTPLFYALTAGTVLAFGFWKSKK